MPVAAPAAPPAPPAAALAPGSALGGGARRTRAPPATEHPPLRELRFLRRSVERERGGLLRHRLHDLVEVSRTDLALVLRRRVPVRLERELALLQLDVGAHPTLPVPARQLEHAGVQRVEPRERDELEAIAPLAQLLLEQIGRGH